MDRYRYAVFRYGVHLICWGVVFMTDSSLGWYFAGFTMAWMWIPETTLEKRVFS